MIDYTGKLTNSDILELIESLLRRNPGDAFCKFTSDWHENGSWFLHLEITSCSVGSGYNFTGTTILRVRQMTRMEGTDNISATDMFTIVVLTTKGYRRYYLTNFNGSDFPARDISNINEAGVLHTLRQMLKVATDQNWKVEET